MFRKLRRQIKDLDRRLRRSAGASPGMDRFSAPYPPENAADRPGLEGIFWSNDGPLVHKWHHYLPIYERYFSALREREVRFLEIGVSKGGSLAMWRRYFGEAAILYGVDIDPACAACNGIHAQVRIGSQSDADFLRRVVDEMGGVDVVLDDGSHISSDIRASLATLFPLLQDGGLYMIEDLHATYWDSHDGGYQKPGSFIEDLRQMVDDMHHWYHDQGQRIAATAGTLSALHLYDSIAVLEKSVVPEPRHSEVGDR
ncbi:MAG: class I SAM-dependent methyltransferase [Pseudomonadota bacterium]